MSWRGLYLNHHRTGGIEFYYFAPVICSNKELVSKLRDLVILYNTSGDRFFKYFAKELIKKILEYFKEHLWDKKTVNNLLLTNGFLSACVKINDSKECCEIEELARFLHEISIEGAFYKEKIISTQEEKDSLDELFYQCKNNILGEELRLSTLECFSEYTWDKSVRHGLVSIKDFLISCVKMPDLQINQGVRRQARYLLYDFVESSVPEDVIRDIPVLILKTTEEEERKK